VKWVRVTVQQSTHIHSPAPSGVMVPNFTHNGYRVCWKCSNAWLLPPEPVTSDKLTALLGYLYVEST